MKNKIREYKKKYKTEPLQKWEGTIMSNWEYNLLNDIGAINDKGIVCEYPVIEITKADGGKRIEDLGGDIQQVKIALIGYNEQKNKEQARIKYVPRKYTEFRHAQEELRREELAINNIPTPEY